MPYAKRDLRFEYSWAAIRGDDPKVSGEPDSTLFNRHEGYEVLYLLNKFSTKYGFDKSAFNRAELMLQDLPSTVRSQVNVVQWLESNWQDERYPF